jgi:uncharacterized protein
MKQLILISALLTIVSCGQTETKEIISTYDNGEPEIIFYYKDKNDSLTYRKEVFFESGKLMYTGNVTKDVKDGVWTWWYENGNKKDQCKYRNGFYADTVYHWFESGQLSQIEIIPENTVRYDNACSCNGTIIRYYENGKLKEKFNSINGKFQGTYTTFDENGGWTILTYQEDVLQGFTTERNIDSLNNLMIVVGQYENGKENGLWRWFDKDSTIIGTRQYKDGELSGLYIEYYPNGKIKEEGKLIKGLPDGLIKFYNDKGELVETQKYKAGDLIN